MPTSQSLLFREGGELTYTITSICLFSAYNQPLHIAFEKQFLESRSQKKKKKAICGPTPKGFYSHDVINPNIKIPARILQTQVPLLLTRTLKYPALYGEALLSRVHNRGNFTPVPRVGKLTHRGFCLLSRNRVPGKAASPTLPFTPISTRVAFRLR